jgi:hypothetical protein
VGRKEEIVSREKHFDPADTNRIQDFRIRIMGQWGCMFLRQKEYDFEFCEHRSYLSS